MARTPVKRGRPVTTDPHAPDPHAIAAAAGEPHLRQDGGTAGDVAPEADEADSEPQSGPLRRCVVTRERLPKERMIRFVISPDRVVVPDLTASLPGRGIWLSALGDVVETARSRGAFARAARGQVTVPPDLASGLQAALARRIADTLGLARRAGQAVSGFAKAREWLAAGRAAVVLQASDGSAAERARLLGGNAGKLPALVPLDGATLGAIFGRDHVVHVAVAPGRLAERLTIEAARLAGLRMTTHHPGGSGAARRATNSPAGAVGRVGFPAAPDETSPVRPDGEQGAGE
ncbi:MAG TPA: RNA-binding protein [Croceibacterium sp.]|nr:RNA-binding protein [Croceibacterium sp.]